MNFAMVINIYIDTECKEKNGFDHPTKLRRFEEENTLKYTINSVNNLSIKCGDKLKIYIFAVAVNEDISKDDKIYNYINQIMKECKYEYLIFTNSDIIKLKDETNCEFFSVKGYPEIRTLGFMIPCIMNEDVIIQIDDDELLRKDYLLYLTDMLNKNPDKYLFTAPYEKEGTVRIKTKDQLKTWNKFSSMDADICKLTADDTLKETLFGFGGNMIVRRKFAEKMFYPFNVPRGEDFSLLLTSRLIYANGNEKAGIKAGNKMFKAYFAPAKEITIIHKPPYEAKVDYLFYLEKNLKRFIMEWNMFSNQKGVSKVELKELSNYMAEMIGYEDMKLKVKEILDEVIKIREFDNERVDKLRKVLNDFIDKYKNINRFEEFKIKQKKYIECIKKLRNNKVKIRTP